MTFRVRSTALLLVVVAIAAGAPAQAQAPRAARDFVPGQVLVRFDDRASRSAQAAAFDAVGGSEVLRMPAIGFSLVSTGLDVLDAVRRLRAESAVAVAEPNFTGRMQLTANDRCLQACSVGSALATQWAPAAINAPAGWDVAPGRFYDAAAKAALPPVRVAVLDTKLDVTQPDWINPGAPAAIDPYDARNGGQLAMSAAADFVPANQQSGNAAYHGTFVAGILAASSNNTQAIAGIGYRAEIVPITVVDGGGATNATALSQGILHAADVGARVINLSLGIAQPSSAVQAAIDNATARGALVVAAAGNNGNNQAFYPAWHTNVMSVGASDDADRLATCSNYSHKTSVVAPGANVVGLDPRTGTGLSVVPCGTSVATPHVSGLAALLFAQEPSRTPAQVRQIIERSADDDRFTPGRDDRFGYGRINVERALRSGDGAPVVTAVRATPPRAQGGTTTITAFATVVSSQPILDAEYSLDEQVAPGAGQPLTPADGTWGGLNETLTTDMFVGLNVAPGAHRLYVRAFDGQRWGASSVGVLIVDRRPPTVSEVVVGQVGHVLQPVPISFRVDDEYSAVVWVVVRVRSQVTGAVAYESEPMAVPVATTATTEWTPGAGDIGPHTLELIATDESNNTGRATASTLTL